MKFFLDVFSKPVYFISIGVSTTVNPSDKIIVVDDGSSDYTAKIAKELGAKVIQHDRNRGKGAALNTCFTNAMSYSPDVIITIDGARPSKANPQISNEATTAFWLRKPMSVTRPLVISTSNKWIGLSAIATVNHRPSSGFFTNAHTSIPTGAPAESISEPNGVPIPVVGSIEIILSIPVAAVKMDINLAGDYK